MNFLPDAIKTTAFVNGVRHTGRTVELTRDAVLVNGTPAAKLPTGEIHLRIITGSVRMTGVRGQIESICGHEWRRRLMPTRYKITR